MNTVPFSKFAVLRNQHARVKSVLDPSKEGSRKVSPHAPRNLFDEVEFLQIHGHIQGYEDYLSLGIQTVGNLQRMADVALPGLGEHFSDITKGNGM